MNFKYDVFISYAGQDRDWAIELNKLLANDGKKKTFFDRESLRAGDDWEAKIEDALEYSQHLVVLWSPHTLTSSPWVTHEIISFKKHAKQKQNPDRRLIFVNLSDSKNIHTIKQQINNALLQKAYLDSGKVDQTVWDAVLNEVLKGLDPNAIEMKIPLVVLTLTEEQVQNDFTKNQLAQIEFDYNLSQSELASRYGETREDCCPMMGTESIKNLLNKMRCEIEQAFTEPKRCVTWHEPDAEFWTDLNQAERFVGKAFQPAELSLLVIDPIAILNSEIFHRLSKFNDCFTNPRTIVAVLSPCGMPMLTTLKELLRHRAGSGFGDYFSPKVPPIRHLLAQCAWNAADIDDVRRHLLFAFGGCALKSEPKPESPILNVGI